jgi:hypothetical protein
MNFKFYKLFYFLGFIILSSCSNEGGTDDSIFIKFTANGQEYVFNDPASAQSMNTTFSGQIGTSTDNANYAEVSLWFPLDFSTGTFSFTGDYFDEGDYKLNIYSNPLNLDDAWASSGSVTINSVNSEYVTGTFSGTVTDGVHTVTITNGSFKVYAL